MAMMAYGGLGTWLRLAATMVVCGAMAGAAAADQVIPDDLIVQGSTCVGFDCVNNENFGVDTIRLKENNLRIHFDDTSSTAGFPANDWSIEVNDQASGGRSHFSIVDRTAGQTLMRICAVADAACTPIVPAGFAGALDPQTAINTANIATNTTTIAAHTTAIALNSANIAVNTANIAVNTANIASNTARISALESTVGGMADDIRQNKDGSAMAIAMGGGGLAAEENFALNLNYGNFAGASAVAMFGGARITDTITLNGGIGYGFASQAVGGRVGLRVGW